MRLNQNLCCCKDRFCYRSPINLSGLSQAVFPPDKSLGDSKSIWLHRRQTLHTTFISLSDDFPVSSFGVVLRKDKGRSSHLNSVLNTSCSLSESWWYINITYSCPICPMVSLPSSRQLILSQKQIPQWFANGPITCLHVITENHLLFLPPQDLIKSQILHFTKFKNLNFPSF